MAQANSTQQTPAASNDTDVKALFARVAELEANERAREDEIAELRQVGAKDTAGSFLEHIFQTYFREDYATWKAKEDAKNS